MAGDGEDLAPLIQRIFCRDQRTGLGGGFHHNHRPRKARDYPIARREVARSWLQSHGLFGQHQALFANLFRQIGVLRRLDHIPAAGKNRDGAGFQCGRMGGGINAPRQAADHHLILRAQIAGQATRHTGAQR